MLALRSSRALGKPTLRAQGELWPGWEVVIGIEVHAQIRSRHKLFSDAQTSGYENSPNTHVSVFDAALPGTLPRLNPTCVELAVRTAMALCADVKPVSRFDRKHYFYSDLPAGYQITQRYSPIAKDGQLLLSQTGTPVRIEQIQLEQDTAKTTFDARRRASSIDLNRAGTGLMEIVSRPDMRSPEEAADYVRTLQSLLRAVGASDGNMEQGSLRCDVNVSVNRPGEPPGTRCEIKNLNSVRFMMVAISSEVFRHIALLENGEAVAQETRGFHEDRHETFKLRSKEDAPDYRYMPDPNIPPLVLQADYLASIRENMPELPSETRDRLLKSGLSERDVGVLLSVDSGRDVGVDGSLEQGVVAYFDQLSRDHDPKTVVNWLTHELLGQLTLRDRSFGDNTVTVSQMGELIKLVQQGELTGNAGKTLLRHLLDHPSTTSATELAQSLSLIALKDSSLEQLCRDVVAAMPLEAQAVRDGNLNVLNKILGRVMKQSRGTANAQSARTFIQDLLQS
ncbi:Glutamyl-tRNA amidotransferase B subunit [Peniophora sp. CONT]|nr:Glutamyl-tRNA amidotransferase B subunit [Peniophora sp. CONT]